MPIKLLMLTKQDEWCSIAVGLAKEKGFQVTHLAGDRDDPLPLELEHLDLPEFVLISFLSPWIIPTRILDRVKKAINIHPGPPNYPGTGCYNFALYAQEKEYGVTAHIMIPQVDRGEIIKVRYFPSFPTDTVYALKERTLDQAILLFADILLMIQTNTIVPCGEQWQRKPYTRKDLIDLCDMTNLVRDATVTDHDKFNRILKATSFPKARDRPFIRIGKDKFILNRSK